MIIKLQDVFDFWDHLGITTAVLMYNVRDINGEEYWNVQELNTDGSYIKVKNEELHREEGFFIFEFIPEFLEFINNKNNE